MQRNSARVEGWGKTCRVLRRLAAAQAELELVRQQLAQQNAKASVVVGGCSAMDCILVGLRALLTVPPWVRRWRIWRSRPKR